MSVQLYNQYPVSQYSKGTSIDHNQQHVDGGGVDCSGEEVGLAYSTGHAHLLAEEPSLTTSIHTPLFFFWRVLSGSHCLSARLFFLPLSHAGRQHENERESNLTQNKKRKVKLKRQIDIDALAAWSDPFFFFFCWWNVTTCDVLKFTFCCWYSFWLIHQQYLKTYVFPITTLHII